MYIGTILSKYQTSSKVPHHSTWQDDISPVLRGIDNKTNTKCCICNNLFVVFQKSTIITKSALLLLFLKFSVFCFTTFENTSDFWLFPIVKLSCPVCERSVDMSKWTRKRDQFNYHGLDVRSFGTILGMMDLKCVYLLSIDTSWFYWRLI